VFERKSLKWPILLAILMIVVLVGLTVGWVLINVFGALQAPNESGLNIYWVLLSVGSIMFAFVLAGVILYLVWIIQNINLNRRQSNFIDSVTHELKTPIASLKLYLQTLDRRPVDDEQRQQFYHTMMQDVDRLDGLINQLLDVARLQQKESDLRSADWIAVHDVILEIASKLQSQYQLPDKAIRMNITPCEVLAHRVDIEVLVRNLLDNAVKYSSDPAEIEIEVKLEDEKIHLAVSDNGPGIPRHLRRKVFSRFYRVGDELERKKPGTGLGLFLVRSIVQRLRGTVRITDLMKKNGSRFLIVIPNGRVSCDISRKNSTPPSQ